MASTPVQGLFAPGAALPPARSVPKEVFLFARSILTWWSASGINVGLSGGEGRPVAELLGQHRYQLDTKGRVALPAKFRESFADGVYLTLGEDGCLYAFPRAEWDRRREELRSQGAAGQVARARARLFFGNAERVDIDG